MAEDQKDQRKDKRPVFLLARVQGAFLLAIGIGMCFFPVTNPHAGIVIAAGLGGLTTGTVSAIARKVFNAKGIPSK